MGTFFKDLWITICAVNTAFKLFDFEAAELLVDDFAARYNIKTRRETKC